jgi:hypothetical protein
MEPFRERYRPIPHHKVGDVEAALKEMLEVQAIRKSKSPWSSAVVMVQKKDGGTRFCIDLRKLNNRTKKDAHPLPRIDDALDHLGGNRLFSSLDLKSSYWQVELEEHAKQYTAFTVGPLGFYECNRMPFGLCNAPATFQRVMEEILEDVHLKHCLIYLDDIVVFAWAVADHIDRVAAVLDRLIKAGLKLKPSKCDLFKSEILYLGNKVTPRGVLPDPRGLKAIAEWAPPSTATGVRQFLGLVSHYRRFVQGFAKMARPLNIAISGVNAKLKKEPIDWTEDCQRAFEQLKEAMLHVPMLAYADTTEPYTLVTDASIDGLGAVLYQNEKGTKNKRPVAFASRALNSAESKYHPGKLEFLALKWAVTEKFHEYLYGAPEFEVQTDNNPLTYLLTTAKLDATGHRWVGALALYNFTLRYIKGSTNVVADALSRIETRIAPGDAEKLLREHMELRQGSYEKQEVKEILAEAVRGPEDRADLAITPPSEEALVPDVSDPPPLCKQAICTGTVQDWTARQREDERISTIIEWLQSGRSTSLQEKFAVQGFHDEHKVYLREQGRLVLKDGLLYRERPNRDRKAVTCGP